MNRRTFLAAGAATVIAPSISLAAPSAKVLRAEALTQQILPEKYAGHTSVLGFNGSVPGPELRVVQGERINVRLENRLEEGAAVHWHGIRLQNNMDGVPILTQSLVNPGDDFYYSFTPRDAGTYWYHSHYISQEQVARGLMGALIIEDETPPDVDHDITAVLTDWRLDPEGQLTEDFENMHDTAHAGRLGNFVKAFLPDVVVKRGERIRLRLINAATDRIFPLIIKGLPGKIVALDGMPIASPRDFDKPFLAPAQRMDVIADVTGTIELEMDHRQGAYPLGKLRVEGHTKRRDTGISALPSADVPTHGEPTQSLKLTMQGGAMSHHHGGDNIWAFNGLSDMQPKPFAAFKRGETAKISLVNDTRFPHGIHLHGHHFHEVNEDGSLGDFRDTSLVGAGQTKVIICTFDNPGRWMLHCHMLSHQAGGMKTWVEVA